MRKKKCSSDYIYHQLLALYPDAHCELNYSSIWQLAVAVSLSAQTTDVAVNRVTPLLFKKFPSAQEMALASQEEIEEIIRSIGLYRNKAKNIRLMSIKVVNEYNGEIPNTREELVKLPGIGRKSANVILSEGYKQPAIAVDTHVSRVAVRLGLAKETDSPEEIEIKLMKYFPKEQWRKLHHLMIFFGRYKCHSRKPECEDCPFINNCFKK